MTKKPPCYTCKKGDKNVIEKPDNECAHKRDHWRLCSACMKAIEPVSVRKSLINLVHWKEIDSEINHKQRTI